MEQTNEILIPATLHPFRVPGGYFEGLSASILSHIHEEGELAIAAPVLFSIDKKMIYSVPAGYFDRDIDIPVAEKVPAKIVVFKSYRRITQYAAAAILAGVLVTGAFMFTDSKSYTAPAKTTSVNTEQTVPGDTSATNEATVTTDENVLPEAHIPVKRNPVFAKKVSLLSDDELQNYLDENTQPEPVQLLEEDTEI